jgi:hypothetical protein
MPKEASIKLVKEKVQNAAFSSYLSMKDESKTKMRYLKYEKFEMQGYLSSNIFSMEEKKLLFALRSKCYSAKNNFKKMNKGSLTCIFKCDQIETQDHVFEHCEPVLAKLNFRHTQKVENIYGSLTEQKSAIQVFTKIDQIRKNMIDNLPPGGATARTPNIISS